MGLGVGHPLAIILHRGLGASVWHSRDTASTHQRRLAEARQARNMDAHQLLRKHVIHANERRLPPATIYRLSWFNIGYHVLSLVLLITMIWPTKFMEARDSQRKHLPRASGLDGIAQILSEPQPIQAATSSRRHERQSSGSCRYN